MPESAFFSDEDTSSFERSVSPSPFFESRREYSAEIGGRTVKIETSRADNEWISHVVRELNGIALLHENWDSYGAEVVNQRTLEHALYVYLKVTENMATPDLPQITPTVDGGVGLLWHRGHKGLEVEIEAPLRVSSYFYDELTGVDDPVDVGIDLDIISRHLNEVLE